MNVDICKNVYAYIYIWIDTFKYVHVFNWEDTWAKQLMKDHIYEKKLYDSWLSLNQSTVCPISIQQSIYTHTDTNTHIHIHTHTHAHTYTHAQTHHRQPTHSHTHTRTNTHTNTHAVANTHTHTHTNTHTHKHTPTHTQVQTLYRPHSCGQKERTIWSRACNGWCWLVCQNDSNCFVSSSDNLDLEFGVECLCGVMYTYMYLCACTRLYLSGCVRVSVGAYMCVYTYVYI